MTEVEHVATEYRRRKKSLEAAGYKVEEFGFENLLIVEVFVAEPRTGQKLVRKQEGVAFLGRTPFIVECGKLMALERLAVAVPHMWVAYRLRTTRESRRE